jgi:hypothetical protein
VSLLTLLATAPKVSITPSEIRTVVIQARMGRATEPPEWPLGEPHELLDYSADVTALLTDMGSDTLVSVTLRIRPSGAGECQVQSLQVVGSIITAMLSGGPPGREYECEFVCATASGRTMEFLVLRPIDRRLAHGRGAGRAPNTNFGSATKWFQ